MIELEDDFCVTFRPNVKAKISLALIELHLSFQ